MYEKCAMVEHESVSRGGHTWLSRPNRITIKKNIIDQNGAPGNNVKAFGYAINARPGPVK